MSQTQLQHLSRTFTYTYQIIVPTETEKIQERHLKHIAEITKNLPPIKGRELTCEQKVWFDRKMRMPIWPEPFRLWPWTKKKFMFKTFSFAKVLESVEPLKETDD